MELPIFKLLITDDETEVNYVAVTGKPAIEISAMCFSKQENAKHNFQVLNEEKRLAMGPLMVADLPIERVDEKGNGYYVILDAENIDKAMVRFFERDYHRNVNLEHDPKAKIEGMVMYQHFIINKEMGIKTPKGFEPLPDGSSFGIYKVTNDQVWEKIKANQFGFSIEGMFKQQPIIVMTPEGVDEIMKALKRSGAY